MAELTRELWIPGLVLLAGLVGSALIASWLATSKIALFTRKSFWKCLEFPWLFLACGALLLGKWGIERKTQEGFSRVYEMQYHGLASSFQESLEELSSKLPEADSNKFGMRHCRSPSVLELSKQSGVELDSPDPVVDPCLWFAFMHSEIERSRKRGVHPMFSQEAGYRVMLMLMRNPFLNRNEGVERQLLAIVGELSARETFIVQNDLGVKSCESLSNHANLTSEGVWSVADIRRTMREGCLAVYMLAGHLHFSEDGVDRLFPVAIFTWWTYILILGLCTRVARTVAEFRLDRMKEIEDLRRNASS